jgi:hypothetical protein
MVAGGHRARHLRGRPSARPRRPHPAAKTIGKLLILFKEFFPADCWSGMLAVDHSMPILDDDDYTTMVRMIRNLLKQIGFENVDDASDAPRR